MKFSAKCAENPFHSETNPEGIINLGTAVNSLTEEMIEKRMSQCDIFKHKRQWQHYYGLNGTPELLTTTASFLTKRFAKWKTIVSRDNLRLVNGVSSGLEALSFVLADPEDVILVPVPTFARFFADMNERMKTNVVGFHLEGTDRDSLYFICFIHLNSSP